MTGKIIDKNELVEEVKQLKEVKKKNLETGLPLLMKVGKMDKESKHKVWDILLSRDIYLAAYEKLKNNKEDMTAGLDGLSLTKIDDIIERIKTHTYQFKPIKFIYISNSFGTFQSIGISGIEDKLVQKVMAMILEAIYDFEDNNIFVDSSHGFRRARSTHTALMEMSKWIDVDYVIEGDINLEFNNTNHQILASILKKRIDDQQFIELYWKAVNANYIYLKSGKREYEIMDVPKGGVLSPILSNIYLHEFDIFIKNLMGEEKSKRIDIYKDNPFYKNISTKISNNRGTIKRTKYDKLKLELLDEVKELEKERAIIPSKLTNYDAVHIKYVRYADDFVIGIRGKKRRAKDILIKSRDFLKDTLKIELNEEKTLLTDINKNRVNFLGAEVRIQSSRIKNNKHIVRVYKDNKRKIRVPGKRTIILAPIEKLVKILADQGICKIKNFNRRDIIPTKKSAWINLELKDIITKYKEVWTDILNYYSFAWNRCQLNLIQYLIQHSAACTIMNKMRLNSRRQVFVKYGNTLKISYKDLNNRNKFVELNIQDNLKRINKFQSNPEVPFKTFYYDRKSY